MAKGFAYRPDIDGLRAVAVLVVIAFHVGVFHLSGGYVGVDVFFVISGYLISSIIFNEIAESRFSIPAFYERRIRRIFPALFFLLFVLSGFAAVFLLPTELIKFGQSELASAFSCSNFYFWLHSGYFDHRNSDLLLHTWSLAVEEQFYILFPVFLFLVRKFFPGRLRLSVFILFLVSLLSSIVVVAKNADTAFYMPYTRAWELLLGTILSLNIVPVPRAAWLRNILALLGLGMIGFACRRYTPLTPFPGMAALLPCVGAGLIISAGESGKSVVYSALSWRPVVFVGLISYSLYLWHWPVLMIYRMGIFSTSAWFEQHYGGRFPPDRFDHFAEIAISLILAVLSWRFVETPFRKGRLRIQGRPLFAAAGGTLAACSLFALLTIRFQGMPGRFPENVLHTASFLDDAELHREERLQRMGTCFVDATTRQTSLDFADCLRQDPKKKNYLLLGDSHAAAIWPALQSALPDVNVMQANVTACPATIDHHRPSVCKSVMDYVFGDYLETHSVEQLLLESNWSPSDLAGLDDTLQWARQHNVQVTVIGSVPQYDAPLARLLAYSVAWNRPNLVAEHRISRDLALDRSLREDVEGKWHFRYASLYDVICGEGRCIEYADSQKGIPLMDDSHHFNQFGAQLVIRRLIERGEIID